MRCEISLLNKLINNNMEVYLNNKLISSINLNDKESLIKYNSDYKGTLLGENVRYIISNNYNNIYIKILFEINISKDYNSLYKNIIVKKVEFNKLKEEV